MMLTHVNELCSFGNTLEGGLHNLFRPAHKGYNSTVGSFSRINVQHLDTFYGTNGIGNLSDNIHVAPFTEVGHALHDSPTLMEIHSYFAYATERVSRITVIFT